MSDPAIPFSAYVVTGRTWQYPASGAGAAPETGHSLR